MFDGIPQGVFMKGRLIALILGYDSLFKNSFETKSYLCLLKYYLLFLISKFVLNLVPGLITTTASVGSQVPGGIDQAVPLSWDEQLKQSELW